MSLTTRLFLDDFQFQGHFSVMSKFDLDNVMTFKSKHMLIGYPRTTLYSDYSFKAQLAIVQINII